MRPNAILTYPKKRINLYCFEDHHKLFFYFKDPNRTGEQATFVFDGKMTTYYGDISNTRFKNWKITITKQPYEQEILNITLPLTLTKFQRRIY